MYLYLVIKMILNLEKEYHVPRSSTAEFIFGDHHLSPSSIDVFDLEDDERCADYSSYSGP